MLWRDWAKTNRFRLKLFTKSAMSWNVNLTIYPNRLIPIERKYQYLIKPDAHEHTVDEMYPNCPVMYGKMIL